MTGPMQPSPAPVPDHAGWRTRVDDVTLRAAAAVPAADTGVLLYELLELGGVGQTPD